jgi:hypothetical protein
LRPQQDVAVGKRQPETILAEAQRNRIVEDAAVDVGDEHVLALPDFHLRKIARRQHLRERRRVGAGDLDLALDRDVAQDRGVDQVPEIPFRIAEVAREVHVIVDGKGTRAPAHGGVEIGRLADLRAEPEFLGLDHDSPPYALPVSSGGH